MAAQCVGRNAHGEAVGLGNRVGDGVLAYRCCQPGDAVRGYVLRGGNSGGGRLLPERMPAEGVAG